MNGLNNIAPSNGFVGNNENPMQDRYGRIQMSPVSVQDQTPAPIAVGLGSALSKLGGLFHIHPRNGY